MKAPAAASASQNVKVSFFIRLVSFVSGPLDSGLGNNTSKKSRSAWLRHRIDITTFQTKLL